MVQHVLVFKSGPSSRISDHQRIINSSGLSLEEIPSRSSASRLLQIECIP